MYEHPAHTYSIIVAEQGRVDRANELRRIIAENPARVVPRSHPRLDRVRSWFRARRADAEALRASAETPRITGDQAAEPAHAR